MKTVEIYHPKTGGRATVPEASLAQHMRAGWKKAETKKQQVGTTSSPEAGEQDESASRTRTSKES